MEMETEYVYKSVYDSEVRRVDEKIENAVTRMEAKSDAYMARVEGAIAQMHGEISEIRGEVKAVRAQVSNMGWTITLMVALMGLVLTCVNIYFAMPH